MVYSTIHPLNPRFSNQGCLDPETNIQITCLLKSKNIDQRKLNTFCNVNKLTLIDLDYNKRHLQVSGSAQNLAKLFGVDFQSVQDETGKSYYRHSNEIVIPPELDFVSGVLGLNNLPCARSSYRRHQKDLIIQNIESLSKTSEFLQPTSSGPYFPPQVAQIYNFPSKFNGAGQKVGILELGGGYVQSDLDFYFNFLGISPLPQVRWVSVDGAVNDPSWI